MLKKQCWRIGLQPTCSGEGGGHSEMRYGVVHPIFLGQKFLEVFDIFGSKDIDSVI